MKLVDFSTSRRVTVAMIMVAIVTFGMVGFSRLSVNLLPDITYPTITIRTEYPGTAPAEVERLVSEPIEGLVGVVSNVVRVSSVSRPGMSDVIVEFGWGTDMDFASLDVREKLDLLQLPQDASKPILLRFDPSLDPILRIALYGGNSLMELRRVAEDRIREIKIEQLMHQVVEIAAHAGRTHPGGLCLKIEHLADQASFPEQAAVSPCPFFFEGARKVGHHTQAESAVPGDLLETAGVSGGLAAIPKGQGVKRHTTLFDMHPGEIIETGGTEGVEPCLVAHEDVKARRKPVDSMHEQTQENSGRKVDGRPRRVRSIGHRPRQHGEEGIP